MVIQILPTNVHLETVHTWTSAIDEYISVICFLRFPIPPGLVSGNTILSGRMLLWELASGWR